MKLTRFTTLSIVATYLLGSVSATGGLFDPECTKEFSLSMLKGRPPRFYDSTVDAKKLKELRKWTKPGISTEKLNKLSNEQVAAAAKIFLLEEIYLETALISQETVIEALEENPLEPPSYHYFIIVKGERSPDIRELKTAIEAKNFAEIDDISEAMGNDYNDDYDGDSDEIMIDYNGDSDDSDDNDDDNDDDDDDDDYKGTKRLGRFYQLKADNPVENKAMECIRKYYEYSQYLENGLHPGEPDF
ncbi:hypothetical protein IWQ61_010097 [Dispira simplex]|nr:hypothetical protein IWQ61_010097 [Dispira simplex]